MAKGQDKKKGQGQNKSYNQGQGSNKKSSGKEITS